MAFKSLNREYEYEYCMRVEHIQHSSKPTQITPNLMRFLLFSISQIVLCFLLLCRYIYSSLS